MKKIIRTSLVFIAFAVLSSSWATPQTATAFNPGTMAKGAPPELQHWGKIVGRWAVEGESLKRDGSGWQPSGKADWDFFWAFNGWGIQDNYTQPPLSEAVEDESKRLHGINLRIYNPKTQQWVLTWLTNQSSKPSNFTATSSDDEVVMMADEVDANGNYRRITFFDMRADSFEWKMEWSQDKENWLEVARIHGKRKP